MVAASFRRKDGRTLHVRKPAEHSNIITGHTAFRAKTQESLKVRDGVLATTLDGASSEAAGDVTQLHTDPPGRHLYECRNISTTASQIRRNRGMSGQQIDQFGRVPI